MTKRVVVTGGAGFIGLHLCRALLARGDSVVVVDDLSTGDRTGVLEIAKRGVTFLEVDVRHSDAAALIASFEPREIYHLACPASPVHYQKNFVRTIETCVLGTRAALDAGLRAGARVLLASTSEVYGDPDAHPQVESYWGNVNCWGPRACYDEGKRCAEALTYSYASQRGSDVRVARIFNTYGPGMMINDGRVVSNFVAQVLRNEPITVFGTGSQTRSFCYVDDTVEALIGLMGSDALGPVNIGNPVEHTMHDLAVIISSAVGSLPNIDYRPLPFDDPRRRLPNIDRAKEKLRWSPVVPLAEGLRRTIEDFRMRIDQG